MTCGLNLEGGTDVGLGWSGQVEGGGVRERQTLVAALSAPAWPPALHWALLVAVLPVISIYCVHAALCQFQTLFIALREPLENSLIILPLWLNLHFYCFHQLLGWFFKSICLYFSFVPLQRLLIPYIVNNSNLSFQFPNSPIFFSGTSCMSGNVQVCAVQVRAPRHSGPEPPKCG